jgi:hypothetical protein
MTPREAFKIGFMSRCVEDGLSLDQAQERVKHAEDLLEKTAGVVGDFASIPGKMLDLAKPVLSSGLGYGIPALAAAPPVLGGIAGYTLGTMGDVDETDVDEIKQRELIAELKRQTARLKRSKKVKDYRSRRKSTGSVFL